MATSRMDTGYSALSSGTEKVRMASSPKLETKHEKMAKAAAHTG